MGLTHVRGMVIAAAAALLAGCSSTTPVPQVTVTVTAAPRTPAGTATSLPPEPTVEDHSGVADPLKIVGPTRVPFGSTVTWGDGLKVHATKPEPFTPDPGGDTGKYREHVRFRVVLTNGTAEPFDPSYGAYDVGSAGHRADEVSQWEMGEGWDGVVPDTGMLDPGHSVGFNVGFGVQDPSDVTLKFYIAEEHEEAVFATRP